MEMSLYRGTTLGITLQETVDEMLEKGLLSVQLAKRVMEEFDDRIQEVLMQKIPAECCLCLDAERMSTYRFFNNYWTFVLKDLNIPVLKTIGNIDKLKIVAFDRTIVKQKLKGRRKLKQQDRLARNRDNFNDNDDDMDMEYE